MSNIINKIRLSGTDYTLSATSSGGANAVEVTQAEYDALVSGGTVDPNTFYIITDATPVDISNYWTSAQTNSAINAAVSGKQDTLSAGTGIDITDNVISATGGGGGEGKAVEAGRGIDVASGESAYTVSFNLPIYSGGTQSIKIGKDNGTLSGFYNLSVGTSNTIKGENSIVVGANNNGDITQYSAIFGYNNTLESYKNYCVVGGQFNQLKNAYETSFGMSSSSKRADYSFGHSGNTLFTIGNGYDWSKTHNALEVRQNGDIYIVDTNDTSTSKYYQKPMIRLQDALGGSSITVDTALDSGSTNPVANSAITAAINAKQDTLISGTNIKTINNQSLLGSGNITIQGGGGGGATYSAGSGINIDSANTISAVYRGWAGERVQYLENISTPFYMFMADDCGGSTFQVSFYINDIQTVVEFDVSTHTYTFIDGDSSWENYVTVEWDTTFGAFKATPNTSINVSDASCARFSEFFYSGTTVNAIDGTLDRIEYIKANGFGNNIEFASRDVENDLFFAPLTLNGVYPFSRTVSFSGGIKSIDGKISTQMQSTPYKWMSGVTIGGYETSTFNAPSSAVTFDISRNPNEYLYAYDANNNGYAFLGSNGDNPNPSDYSVVIDNGSVTVTALNTDKYITKIADGQSELGQYVSDVQYWGYETDTIPNVVLNIKDTIGNINTILESI